jgi:hypothetical protein
MTTHAALSILSLQVLKSEADTEGKTVDRRPNPPRTALVSEHVYI